MFRIVSILTTVFIFLMSSPVIALTHTHSSPLPCTDRANVLNHLSSRYLEKPVAMGLAHNGGIIEILSSKSGSSWTIIITMPDGMTCMIASGKNWEDLPQTFGTGPNA